MLSVSTLTANMHKESFWVMKFKMGCGDGRTALYLLTIVHLTLGQFYGIQSIP